MGDVYIYGFVCPIENKVMYVGKASDVEFRLKQHMNKARRGEQTIKAEWLRELQSLQLSPSIVILEKCHNARWQQQEAFWINHYRSINPELKNTILPKLTRRNKASFSLEREYYELLKQIATMTHMSATVEVRGMIDRAAVKVGLQPIAPLA